MNLHSIVAGVIGAVNPLVPCTLQLSTGYVIALDGTQVPNYSTFANVLCQVQELSSKDLAKLDGLNIQGSTRAVYTNGQWQGVVRVGARGGDIMTMADGTVYLITAALEVWPDWTKFAATLQNERGN